MIDFSKKDYAVIIEALEYKQGHYIPGDRMYNEYQEIIEEFKIDTREFQPFDTYRIRVRRITALNFKDQSFRHTNPCILQTYPMTTDCVACWNSSKISGVKCHRCKNVALCIECYHEWKEKGNNCPLCRAYYIV